jgi:hypothetical protein
VRERVRKR